MDISAQLQALGSAALRAARWVWETLGIAPSFGQAVALMMALFMLCGAAWGSYDDWILRRRGRRTTGSVLSIEDIGESWAARVGFRDDAGQDHTFYSSLTVNWTRRVVGDAVEVVYDPLYPKRARETGRGWARLLASVILCAFALLVLAVALGGRPH